MEDIISLKELVSQAVSSYKDVFEKEPELCVFAPGRVNLIGEHTDYNDGFVFPMALPLVSVVVGGKSDVNVCKIATACCDADTPKQVKIPLPSFASLTPGLPKWANYVKGVIFHHPNRDDLPAFNALVASSVPCGSGLSSSAALETATFTFLDALLNIERPSDSEKKEKALVCQLAEHTFARVPCGIMDQFISSVGNENHALLIDCRSLEAKSILFDDADIAVLITNSNVKHELSTGEYGKRKEQCQIASTVLGKNKLRDATMEELNEMRERLDDVCYRRAKHVILENERCEQAFAALEEENFKKFGELMIQSHESLRDDYEVSCPELDQLVLLTLEKEGVYGSRMTGGGFGGCTVTLLEKKNVEEVVAHVKAAYKGTPTFYLCSPSSGANKVDLKKILEC